MPRTSTNPCFPLLVIILIILSGCQAKNKKDPATEALRLSLENADRMINFYTSNYFTSIQKKADDPCTAESAAYILPKAEKIIDLSKVIKEELKKYNPEAGTSSDSIASLLVKLKNYKSEILAIDSSYLLEFKNQFSFIDQAAYLLTGDSLDATINPGTIKKEILLSCLSLIHSGICKTENKLIAFSHSRLGCHIDGFKYLSGIVGQDKEFVRPGGKLNITAGIGDFYTELKPAISIYGKEVPLNEMGIVNYMIKAPAIPGKYYVPVTISFRDPIVNKQVEQSFTVKYTVEEPCNQ